MEPPEETTASEETPAPPVGGSLSRQAGIVIVARGVAFFVAFVVPVVLVRVIDQQQYGHYRQAVFLLAVFYPILQFGTTQSLFYFYPREPARRRALVTQTVGFLAATSVVFAVLLVAARGLVGAYFNDAEMTRLAPLIGPYVGLMVLTSVLDVLPVVQQKMRLAFAVILSSETLRAALLVTAAVATRDVRVLVAALVVFAAARAAFMLVLLRVQGLLGTGDLGTRFVGKQLAYSVPFGLAGTVVTLIQMSDRLYVSRYFDASQFAIYSVGCYQLPLIMIVFQSAASVMLGRMAALQAADQVGEMLALLRNAVRKLSLVALPAVAVAIVLGRDLITVVYTGDYAAATPIFMVFLALIPRSATAYGTVTRAYGLTRWIFQLSLWALVVAVVLVFALTPRLGLVGPALAVVVALWVVAGGQIWKSARLLGCGLRGLYPWGELGRIAAVAAVPAVGLAFVRAHVEAPPAVHLLAGGGVYALIVGVLALRLGLVRPAEWAAARAELRRRLGGAP
ncbi:MAG: lipopolysaccharide biosynthesis protein [Candidatus Eiseniibacteriota bacterium]|jgi:O-antigen/teichoic acid export membrane protein